MEIKISNVTKENFEALFEVLKSDKPDSAEIARRMDALQDFFEAVKIMNEEEAENKQSWDKAMQMIDAADELAVYEADTAAEIYRGTPDAAPRVGRVTEAGLRADGKQAYFYIRACAQGAGC